MVCGKCEKKLGKIATPNPWKAGQSSGSNESSGRKVNENKLLSSKKNRFNPYTTSGEFNKCRICRTKVHQVGAHYCQDCAYKKGICAMCGTKNPQNQKLQTKFRLKIPEIKRRKKHLKKL